LDAGINDRVYGRKRGMQIEAEEVLRDGKWMWEITPSL
jgi:hypothetical protein